MNVQFDANALFQSAWNNAAHTPQKTEQTETEKAMNEFAKARSACYRAADTMMDEHHKTVAESAKKMNAYYKQKKIQDQARDAASDRHDLGERIRVEVINHRNMLESRRAGELDREKQLA